MTQEDDKHLLVSWNLKIFFKCFVWFFSNFPSCSKETNNQFLPITFSVLPPDYSVGLFCYLLYVVHNIITYISFLIFSHTFFFRVFAIFKKSFYYTGLAFHCIIIVSRSNDYISPLNK